MCHNFFRVTQRDSCDSEADAEDDEDVETAVTK
jgi:hypothetical protein